MTEPQNQDHKTGTRRPYLLSTIYGVLTLVQLVAVFFIQVGDGWLVVRILGWILWLLSILFGILPILIFRSKGGVHKGDSYIKTTVLVEDGLYGIVRHPQYLAGILLNLALMMISQHWLIILLGAPAVILMYLDLKNADQAAITKFGNAYRVYMDRVPQTNFILGIIRCIHYRKEKS